MIPINVTKLFVLLFFIFSLNDLFSQEVKKESIYLLFKNNERSNSLFKGKKFINDFGLNFNLMEGEVFIHKKGMKKDTLPLSYLREYKLTNENSIEKKATLWRKKNRALLKKKYGVLSRQTTAYKNNVFNVFIIEKINSKQIVLYQVKFRNEGIMPK